MNDETAPAAYPALLGHILSGKEFGPLIRIASLVNHGAR